MTSHHRRLKNPTCMLLPSQADLRVLQWAACNQQQQPVSGSGRQVANLATSSKRFLAAGTLPAQQHKHHQQLAACRTMRLR